MARISLPTAHVYRGTTPGWPGSNASQALGITCTSTDPLVATLFAINCLRHGTGVVHVTRFEQVNGLCAESNVLSHLECEISFAVSPETFERLYVTKSVGALEARDILLDLGFLIPTVIYNITHLGQVLHDTQQDGQRLEISQIAEFDRRLLS